LALQYQRADGSALSEFGALVNRQAVQIVTALHF
jgi:hypothetical protein